LPFEGLIYARSGVTLAPAFFGLPGLPAADGRFRGGLCLGGEPFRTFAETRAIFNGEHAPPRVPEGVREPGTKKASAAGRLARGGQEKPAICSDSQRADEGTRTLDLLHGKQTL
jgi:hypothetical protein